ncbi:hypothetical protein CVT24_007605 [Panaeolus cyanescens]|uniref:Uncharacterized protein n=1 Tax=Panaeolus cyanescens TaxID=181874 RepID=A0A409WA34_9AGAR|nr:hypothetical protein CVT24_007605 [Panaeolus cyanescens]
MWDELHGIEAKKRAEGNFAQLRDDVWKLEALLGRIESARQQRQILQDDRTQLLTHPNPDQDAILVSCLRAVDQQLTNYIHCLVTFKSLPPGFDINVKLIVYQRLLELALSSQNFVHAVESTLAQLPPQQSNDLRTLKAVLRTAKIDFMQAYSNLRKFGPPPPESQSLIPDFSLTTADRILLPVFAHTERLNRWLKRS